jgi:hypothetical protein
MRTGFLNLIMAAELAQLAELTQLDEFAQMTDEE